MSSIQELDAHAERVLQLTNELASLEKELAQLTNNKQSTPCSHRFAIHNEIVECEKCGEIFPCYYG